MNYKGRPEEQLANMSIEPNFSELIEAEDFVRICIVVIKDTPDNLKSNVRRIMERCRSMEKISKFLSALISVLNNDLSLWKCENAVKMLFNELEEETVLLLTPECNKLKAQGIYASVLENQFDLLFTNHCKYLEKMLASPVVDSSFDHISIVLINFAKLVEIKSYLAVLYPMARFAEFLLNNYITCEVIQPLIMDFIVNINYRLIDYLAVTPGNPVSKGLKETISIYDIIRKSIISMTLVNPEVISNALSVLEHRSRFFGLNADAIPENENHGDYIVIDPLNAPFEDDDVYDDYEKFLATLPN